LLAVLLIRALFNPSEDEETKELWGWLGTIIMGGLGIVALYFYNHH